MAVVWWNECDPSILPAKFALLARAQAAKLSVPAGFFLTQEMFKAYMKGARLDEHLPYLYDSSASPDEKARQMAGYIAHEPLSEDMRADIIESFNILTDERSEPAVVRTIYAAFHAIGDEDALFGALKVAWAGAFDAQWFREQHGRDDLPDATVLVQRAIQADHAARAVMDGGAGEVRACFGLPQGCVSDNAERFTISAKGIVLAEDTKAYGLYYDPIERRLEKHPIKDKARVLDEQRWPLLRDNIAALSALVPKGESVWAHERGRWWLISAAEK